MRAWEIHGIKDKDLKTHDVAIVLGGMSEFDNDLDRLSIRRGGDRIWQAITLYQQGKVKKLLISGASGYVFDRGLKEAEQMKKDLVKWGIPEEDILTEEKSINTYENALYSAEVLQQHPELKSFVLVTSASHMRRSIGCFEKQGLHCTPYSTDQYTGKKRFYFWDQYFIPNMETMIEWKKLIKEWVGYIAYDLKGYI